MTYALVPYIRSIHKIHYFFKRNYLGGIHRRGECKARNKDSSV